jgi:hypothetical protein
MRSQLLSQRLLHQKVYHNFVGFPLFCTKELPMDYKLNYILETAKSEIFSDFN